MCYMYAHAKRFRCMTPRTRHNQYAQAGQSVADGSADGEHIEACCVIRLTQPKTYSAICSGDNDETFSVRHALRLGGRAVCLRDQRECKAHVYDQGPIC